MDCPYSSNFTKNIRELEMKKPAVVDTSRPISSYNLPPGPALGSDKADFLLNKKLLYKKMAEQYVPEYGTVVTLYQHGTPVVFINDFENAYDIFVKRYSKEVSGRELVPADEILSGNRSNILNCDYGPFWKVVQRQLHNGLRHCAAPDRIDEIMHSCFEKFKERIKYREGSKDEGLDVRDDLFWMADNVITMLLFNEIFEEDEHKTYSKTVKAIPSHKLTGQNDSLKSEVNKLKEIVKNKMEEHRRKGDYKIACLDITDFMLLSLDEYRLDPLPKKLDVELKEINVIHSFIDVILASIEGLGDTFVWIFGLLALYPEIQDKIRHEINTFRDDINTKVTLLWKSKMHYTNAALCEMQRFSSGDTFTDVHIAMADIKLGTFEIPKDSLVLLNLYAIHRDSKNWPEPEKIIPERFLSETEQRFKRRKGFVPFGLGLRRCTAYSFVENVIFILVTLLVDNYRLIWSDNINESLVDDDDAVFFRNVKPFNVQFLSLK